MLLRFLGIVGTITLILLLILEVVVLLVTKTNSSIHDLLSDSVVVDAHSQKIFDSLEQLAEYEAAEAARAAAEAEGERKPIATGIFAPRATKQDSTEKTEETAPTNDEKQ